MTGRSRGPRGRRRSRLAAARPRLLLLAAVAISSLAATPSPPLTGWVVESVRVDPVALDFVVQSKIYPEDPDSMFLTLRGGGVSVYDVSVPANPILRTRWHGSDDVEGQDRLGDLLVVVARAGELLSFDVSDRNSVRLASRLALETDRSRLETLTGELLRVAGNGPFAALHVRLDVSPAGRIHAFVTAPESGELLAVDVTDPARPVQVGRIDTGVQLVEGIFIHEHHAFVGGFGGSGVLRAIDVSDPRRMVAVGSLSDPDYRQMVSEMRATQPGVLFAALWGDPGGLAAFDVADPARVRLLDKQVRPELRRSNRVKLSDGYAYLPLEQTPGGLAVFDVSDPEKLRFVAQSTGFQSVEMPYTLEVNGAYVYLFGSASASMAVLRLVRGPVGTRFARWNFGSGSHRSLLADGGLAADAGQGRLHFLDPEDRGANGTAARTTFGSAGGIGHLALDPAPGWSRHNGLWLQHGLPHDFHGNRSAYTLVFDLQVPRHGYATERCSATTLARCHDIALYQLDRTNRNDAELFLKVGSEAGAGPRGFVGKTGDPVTGGGLGGYAEAITPDRWHRVAMVVDLHDRVDQAVVYVDGRRVLAADGIDYAKFASISQGNPGTPGRLRNDRDGFLLFADNSGEMRAPIRVGSLLFVDRAYGPDEIAALGVPDAAGIPTPGSPAPGNPALPGDGL